MTFWNDKRVLLTGGAGFLGSYVAEKLRAKEECARIFIPRSIDFNLLEKQAARDVLKWSRPDIVIHLAAVCGGIGANQANPGYFFYSNAIMGIQLIEQARLFEVQKFVCVGTVCSYPKLCPVPFKEEDLWNGYPEETNAPYGLAKKALLVQLQAYRQEYGFNGIYLLPVNLYGPRDNFDLRASHVIPALIRKFETAKKNGDGTVTLWGTGAASREFLYAEDAAEGIVRAAEFYNKPDPINLGAGKEISIRDLASLVAKLTGFEGKIEWDKFKPDGQPRRCLDTRRAEEEFGFRAKTPLQEGLMKSIDWYRRN